MKFSELVVLPELQTRIHDDRYINELRSVWDEIKEHGKVWIVDGKPHLVDGHARLQAGKLLGKTEGNYEVLGEGTLIQAIGKAYRANSTHGRRMSQHEKRQYIRKAHDLCAKTNPKWRRCQTAELLGVSGTLISNAFLYPNGYGAERDETQVIKKGVVSDPILRQLNEISCAATLLESKLARLQNTHPTNKWNERHWRRFEDVVGDVSQQIYEIAVNMKGKHEGTQDGRENKKTGKADELVRVS